MIANKDKK